MQIRRVDSSSQNKSCKPNFGHTFKVAICVKNDNGVGYRFVSPIYEKKLYKSLNSKIVGWLNEKYITNLREVLGTPRKVTKRKTYDDAWAQEHLIRCLFNIDSDYRRYNIVRSVYNRNGLAYIATGIDVPIIENLNGATKIGTAKADALFNQGITRSTAINEIVNSFKHNSLDYVKNENNLLRSSNGKEIMLRLDFKAPKTNKKGKPIYELENTDFYEIKKSQPMSIKDRQLTETRKIYFFDEIKKTIQYQISKITKGRSKYIDLESVFNPLQVRPKISPAKNPEPVQLTLNFKD